jgi:hypothetical protein
MSDKPSVTEVLDWSIPGWSPNVVMPTAWAEDKAEPSERGPFYVIHCGDRDTALHVCELLNEEVERVMRAEGLTP